MAFDRKTIWIAVSLFAVLVLAAANWAATKEATWPTDWHELVTCDPSDKRFMLLQVVGELPPLKLTALSGKIKFISFAKPTWAECPIGYVIDLTTLPIPKDEVPEKYK